MNAAQLLCAVAPDQRSAQEAITYAIEEFLDDDSAIMCVNAETGIGKTLAYSVPAALAAAAGRKVVVSTHTTQQVTQVLATMHRVRQGLPGPINVVQRLGRANFISPGRVARLLANRDDLEGEDRALLDAARGHAGLIDEFEADHGPLPVSRADICLSSSCRHQAAYEAQRAEAEAADIVVQTHSMSVLDAVRGEIDADIAIYDEGDTLPSAAAGFAESRVTPLDFMAIQDRHSPHGLSEAVAAFETWARETVGDKTAAFKQYHPEAVRHATAIGSTLEGIEAEHPRDVRRALSRFVSHDSATLYRGAAVVAAAEGHAFEVLALNPGRILRRTYDRRKTLFVSATLVAGSENFEPFLRSVGADRCAGMRTPVRAEIENFGGMSFALADRGVPTPFGDNGLREPAFDEFAACTVRKAMDTGGRVLVLTPSFADVEEIARRIPGIIAHRRGEALPACLEALKSSDRGVLATPAAWAGTDLPGLVDHIVILRLPFPPPEAAREALLRRLLETRGYGDANAASILRSQNRRETIRRLAQGMGRGVRTPDDRVKVWIADPRFPFPDTIVRDPRLMISQGLATNHRELAQAIPGRFREAYECAEIVLCDDDPASP